MSQRTLKATTDVVKRLAQIRAITLAINNDPDTEDVSTCALEFFYAVLDTLEGKPIEQLSLKHIDPDRVTKYLKSDI